MPDEELNSEIVDDNEELLLETDAPEDEPEGDLDAASPDDEDGETVLLLGDEAPDDEIEEDTPAVRQMRARIKELNKENRQLRTAAPVAAAPKIELGPEPTMEDPDVEWDHDKFKEKLATWLKAKATQEREQEAEREQAEKANTAWLAELATYEKRKTALAIPGKEEAEEEALSKLSQLQQAIIVKHPNNAAIMIALGKYPKKLATVAAVSDPVNFAYAIADIGRELKVTTKRKAPPPDGIVRGDARMSGATELDKKRNAILDKMAAGGDVTKLRAQLKALNDR